MHSQSRMKNEGSTQGYLCVCHGVAWTVVYVWKKSGGMVDTKDGKDGVKDTVTQKQNDALFPQATFSLLFLFFLFPNPFSLSDSPVVPPSTLYHPSNTILMHSTRAYPK